MSWVPCKERDCNESVELPVDQQARAAVSPEDVPEEREVVLVCPRGHNHIYIVSA